MEFLLPLSLIEGQSLSLISGSNFNIVLYYSPQKFSLSSITDGQIERVNQVLEDMLRACAISFPEKWDECLTLAEFSYNNSYQESIRMAPFEALHGKKCRTPLNWVEVGDRGYFGPNFIKEASEQVSIIQSHLKAAQSCQKTYAEKRRRPL